MNKSNQNIILSKNDVAADTLIVTYNHYINNSLTKISGALHLIERMELAKECKHMQGALGKINMALHEINNFLRLIRDDKVYQKAQYHQNDDYLVFDTKTLDLKTSK